jgi:hypothetical protein
MNKLFVAFHDVCCGDGCYVNGIGRIINDLTSAYDISDINRVKIAGAAYVELTRPKSRELTIRVFGTHCDDLCIVYIEFDHVGNTIADYRNRIVNALINDYKNYSSDILAMKTVDGDCDFGNEIKLDPTAKDLKDVIRFKKLWAKNAGISIFVD